MYACIKKAGIEAWRKGFCLFNFLSCTDTETPLVTSRLNPPSVAVAVAKCNIQNIARKFAVLTIKSCKSLQERGVDIEDVQMFLITVYSSPPNSKDASGTVTTVLESAKNLKQIFCALSKYRLWDYLNYYLLQNIVEAFVSDDDELKGMITEYQKDLTGHVLTQKIETYLDATSDSEDSADDVSTASTPSLFRKLTFKCEANITEHSLSYIDDLRQSISQQFAIPPTALMIQKIAKGCICITYQIPTNLGKHVTSRAKSSTSMFAKECIMEVMLEGQHIYTEPHLQAVERELKDLKKKKIEVEKELKLKEEELESLHTVHQKDSEQLENKKEEIRVLRQRLQAAKSELISESKLSEKLKERKIEVEKQLNLMGEELESLRTVHQKDSEQLQHTIRNKEEEIRKLHVSNLLFIPIILSPGKGPGNTSPNP